MTSVQPIDPTKPFADQLAASSPDLLRDMLASFIQSLMSAEADAVCGAGYGERSTERVTSRNGYRHRDFDTRVGTIDVAIPKLRSGSYFPDWLLERRKRAERALTSVVATCYLLGVSTRRMEKLVESLGITSLSKSQVSIMARDLDAQVEAFRTRPLDQGPYTFVAADALVLKVRENGRVVNVHCLIATGVNAEGYREILARPGHLQRRRRRLAGLFPRPARPRPDRCQTRHLRRPRRAGRGDRRHLARSVLAALPHSLHGQPHVGLPEELLALGADPAALGVRPSRRRIRCRAIRSNARHTEREAAEGGRSS
jgi:hypothetical protein